MAFQMQESLIHGKVSRRLNLLWARFVPHVACLVLVAALISSPGLASEGTARGTDILASWNFNEESGQVAVEAVSGSNDFIHQIRNDPERPSGISGRALRIDGYSTFVEHLPGAVNDPLDALTVECWVAVRAYPFQSTAAFVNQHVFPEGFFFGLDEFGFWNFSVGSGPDWRTVFSPAVIPKKRWLHIAGTYDRNVGLKIYLDGNLHAEALFQGQAVTPRPSEPLLIGRHNQPQFMGIFPLSTFNGLIDNVRIWSRALSGNEIRGVFEARLPLPPAEIIPPRERFRDDNHFPGFHAMPPADWTNEPHGLVHYRGNFHFFHQYNPNGPYFGNQHWGHLWSPDLVHWNLAGQAFWPGLGPDRRGTWTGDAKVVGNDLFAVYTSNDIGQSQSLATSNEDLAINWNKFAGNPVLPALPPNPCDGITGFRDPELFELGDGFTYALIGSGCPTGGGDLHLYRTTDFINWEYRGIFFEGHANADGSDFIWEIPQLVPLNVDGRWALFVNPLPTPRSAYWIGTIQGERFVRDFEFPKLLDHGPQFLAPMFGIDPQGRNWMIGVVTEDRFSDDQLRAGWANGFSLPRFIRYDSVKQILTQIPAPQLADLRLPGVQEFDFDLNPGDPDPIGDLKADPVEIRVRAEMPAGARLAVDVRETPDSQERTRILYQESNRTLTIDRSISSTAGSVGKWNINTPFALDPGEELEMTIYVDRSIIEVFLNNRISITTRIYPTRHDALGVDLIGGGATIPITSLEVWPLRDINTPSQAPTAAWRVY